MRVRLTAAGNPEDYEGNFRKRKIRKAFAAALDGIDLEDVKIIIVAGSVEITVDIDVPAEVEPNGVVDTLTPQLSDTTAASTFLADASVVVESVEVPELTLIDGPSPPPPSPPPSSPPSDPKSRFLVKIY